MSTEVKTSQHRAEMLEGAPVANRIKQEVAAEIVRLREQHSFQPGLAAIRVGTDAASEVYVRNKIRACAEVGIRSEQHALPESTSEAELLRLVAQLNARDDVDGILVQLPLPQGINEAAIIEAVDPAKDVDGFHPTNVGKLAMGNPRFVPCTPAGVMELLRRSGTAISGANACVVGRSQIVGRPMAQLLLQQDATVTICHSRTRDLPALTRQADILVVAIGRAGFIRGEDIKRGATVIDVGMNRVSDPELARTLFDEDLERRLEVIAQRGATLVGDVNPSEAAKVAGKLTPVPGGVGLLTVAMLMKNTLNAAKLTRAIL
jgi:methylenetetrahydrofolate dehydrogenase (NADP+)/methenyltetrahydrofolate cyclohydrolase